MHACSGLWISCPNAGSIPKYWISHASTPEDLTSSVLTGNGRTLPLVYIYGRIQHHVYLVIIVPLMYIYGKCMHTLIFL